MGELRDDPEWVAAAKVIYEKGGIAVADRRAYLAERAAVLHPERESDGG